MAIKAHNPIVSHSGTHPPDRQKQPHIGSVDHLIAVEIRIASLAWPPGGQEGSEVRPIDHPVFVEIAGTWGLFAFEDDHILPTGQGIEVDQPWLSQIW